MPGMTIDESARRLGGLVWTERRLFELLGRWVPTTADAASKVAFAVRSRRHGDHAVALEGLLPDTRDHDPEAFVVPLGEGSVALESAHAAEQPDERLGVLEHTLAGHRGALEEYLALASPVRDGPGIRVVTAVLVDDRADLERLGEHLGR